jgi:hypothetical protein
MAAFQGLNRFIALYVDTIKQIGRGRIWGLLFLYFLFDWLILYAHYDFFSPIFYGLINPWIHIVNGRYATGFTHYPGHFLTLPYFFGWAKFYAGILVEGAVLGAVAMMFYYGFVKVTEREEKTFGGVVYLWFQLVLAWLVINGIILFINVKLPGMLHTVLVGSPRRIYVFTNMVQPFLYVLTVSFFFFAIPYIVVHQVSFARGLLESLKIFLKHPFTAFFLSLTIMVVPLLLNLLINQEDTIVNKFRPELIYWLLLIGLVVDMAVNFLWMGTATRFLIEED